MIKQYKLFISTAQVGGAVPLLTEQLTTKSSQSNYPLTAEELRLQIKDADALVSVLEDRIDEPVLAACPQLKVVANVAVGYDNIDLEAATKRGVLVCNTPGVLDGTTADLAFGLLMTAARRIVEADKYVRDGKWQRWSVDLLLGTDVAGKTLGIIGLGRIGQAMARRASGFDMKILYTQRNPAAKSVEQAYNATYVQLDELLRTCDFVSIHCPLAKQTRHLLGMRELSLMKDSAILINTARGAIVDGQALVKALVEKRIRAAGLDVFEDEPHVAPALYDLSNVVITPHIGSASVETRSAMAMLAAQGVLAALNGKLPDNAVNKEVFDRFLERLHGTGTGQVSS